MSTHHETNPHFVRPSRDISSEPDDQHRRPTTTSTAHTTPWTVQPHHEPRSSQRSRHRKSHHQTPVKQPPAATPTPTPVPLVPLHTHHPDEQDRLQPPRGPRLQRDPFPRRRGSQGGGDDDDDPLLHPKPLPSHEAALDHHHGSSGPKMPQPRKTGAHTWFLAVFCAALWIVVILGGVVVLIVYLVFRPRSPRFEVSAAALNAAYLDSGYLLNADISLLANFTNPNRKVGIEFSRMYVELRYGSTLVATQYIEPFTARKGRNTFASLHMVTSQVRLSELELQRIKRQILTNRIVFELRGFFRAKSKFGGLLRYSYWLHSKCTIVLTKPPGGVLVARRCKTSH